jgi:predicted nucleic acid-binding protein
LKVLFPDPESRRVMQLVSAEEHVVVSTLARLETVVQIHARAVGGFLTRPAARSLVARLETVLRQVPYDVVRMPAEVVDLAEAQVRPLARDAYCPTLDRLHLAVMKALDVQRLLTNDDAQARAAQALGFSVVVPR